MELFPTHDIASHRQTWTTAIDNAPMARRLIRTSADQTKRWDQLARLFEKNGRPQGNAALEADIVRRFLDKGALHPKARVLDIGAGLGDLTMALARLSGQVTALEPSTAMAGILEDRTREQGIQNIHVDRRRWQQVDINKEGLLSRFDLVVASMNPGVSHPDDLEKMNQVSKGFCFLSRFSGMHGIYGFEGIWEHFFNEDPGTDPWDIIFPFNLLYAMGYRPELTFITRKNPGKIDRNQAVQQILASLWNYMDPTQEVEDTVASLVKARTRNGLVSYDKGYCQGAMIWQAADHSPI